MLPDPNDRVLPSRSRRRWTRVLPMTVALVAIAVFGGLIGYTYMSRSVDTDGTVPTIRADQRPLKSRPDNPGGMDVPNQDKEIFERLARNAGGSPPPAGQKVERLLPPPEAPLPRPVAPPIAAQIPAPPDVTPPQNAVEVAQPKVTSPPTPLTPPVAATPPAPRSQPQQQQAAMPPQPAVVPRPEPIAPAAIAPAAGPTSGRYRVQLAALRSSEEANREWEKLRKAHPELLGNLGVNVVRADLGERGTFYRIQAGPVADEANAKDLCRKLVDKKVGCLVVRP